MATDTKATADLIDSDQSENEINQSDQNFDLNFDVLKNIIFSDAPVAKANTDMEWEVNADFPADDEMLADCLSQIEEKENVGKRPRFPELKEQDFLDLEDSKDSRGTVKQTKWAVSLFRGVYRKQKTKTGPTQSPISQNLHI